MYDIDKEMMYPERDEILKDIGKATTIWWLLKIIFSSEFPQPPINKNAPSKQTVHFLCCAVLLIRRSREHAAYERG